MAKPDADYVIAALKVPNHFTVTKFGDSDTPMNVYNVMYNPITGYGRCDCPAGTYRKLGPADKHVKMVKDWLAKDN